MGEIVIEEGKNVVFNNLLSRKIGQADQSSIQKQSAMFDQYISRKRLEPYGPIIIQESMKTVNNASVKEYEMMIQIKTPPQTIDDPYVLTSRMRIEGCLIAKYVGPTNKMFYAHYKIQTYAFEHNLGLGPVTYTVYTKDSAGGFQADIIVKVI